VYIPSEGRAADFEAALGAGLDAKGAAGAGGRIYGGMQPVLAVCSYSPIAVLVEYRPSGAEPSAQPAAYAPVRVDLVLCAELTRYGVDWALPCAQRAAYAGVGMV